MSYNNPTQPKGQSFPETPLEIPNNPNSTIVDAVNFESQLSQYHLPPRSNRGIPPINMNLTLNQKLDILLVTMYLPKNYPSHMLLMCYSYRLCLFLVKCQKL